MAKYIDPATNHCRTTDHSEEIGALRFLSDNTPNVEVGILARCAADLLEVHDATGISLDDWTGPRNLVNFALSRFTTGGTLLPNGV